MWTLQELNSMEARVRGFETRRVRRALRPKAPRSRALTSAELADLTHDTYRRAELRVKEQE